MIDGKEWICEREVENRSFPRELAQTWADIPLYIPADAANRRVRRVVMLRWVCDRNRIIWPPFQGAGENASVEPKFANLCKKLKTEDADTASKEMQLFGQCICILCDLALPELISLDDDNWFLRFLSLLSEDVGSTVGFQDVAREWDQYESR